LNQLLAAPENFGPPNRAPPAPAPEKRPKAAPPTHFRRAWSATNGRPLSGLPFPPGQPGNSPNWAPPRPWAGPETCCSAGAPAGMGPPGPRPPNPSGPPPRCGRPGPGAPVFCGVGPGVQTFSRSPALPGKTRPALRARGHHGLLPATLGLSAKTAGGPPGLFSKLRQPRPPAPPRAKRPGPAAERPGVPRPESPPPPSEKTFPLALQAPPPAGPGVPPLEPPGCSRRRPPVLPLGPPGLPKVRLETVGLSRSWKLRFPPCGASGMPPKSPVKVPVEIQAPPKSRAGQSPPSQVFPTSC